MRAEIFFMNADGSGKRHVATGNPFDFAPRWSPNSQWLALSANELHHQTLAGPPSSRRGGSPGKPSGQSGPPRRLPAAPRER